MSDADIFPTSLKRSLEAGSVVAFVGAGFTLPLGFPTWSGLLKNLLEFVRECHLTKEERKKTEQCERMIRAGKLAEGANELKRLITPTDFSLFLTEQFSKRRREQAADESVRERMRIRLKHLTTSSWAGIVTTNFDDYIEASGFDFRANGDDPDLGNLLSRREPFYVKLHSRAWQSDVVLTSEDYFSAYLQGQKAPTLPHFLRAMILSHQIVFIGCSLEHRILEVRKELSQIYSGRLPYAWALVPKTRENTERAEMLKRDFQIQLITYATTCDPLPPHSAVDRFLEIASSCARSRVPFP